MHHHTYALLPPLCLHAQAVEYIASSESTLREIMQGWVIMYALAQFIFGFGIGGEYPMTSTRATEESSTSRKRGQRHRGRKVMLAYTMQVHSISGLGNHLKVVA